MSEPTSNIDELDLLVQEIEANVSQPVKNKLKFMLANTKKLNELNLFKVQSILEL